MMLLSKIKWVAAWLLVGGMLCTGTVVTVHAWKSNTPPSPRQTAASEPAAGALPAGGAKPKLPPPVAGGAQPPADVGGARLPEDDPTREDRPSDPLGPKKAPTSAKVRALLEKKLAILNRLAELVTEAHKKGAGSFAEVIHAQKQVAAVELELADTPQKRVAILEKLLALEHKVADDIRKLHKQGVATATELLRTELAVTDAEIALERARAEMAAPK
jgi:hypothetical protein